MKKLLAILMSVILVMVLVIGCAPEETPPENENPATNEGPGTTQPGNGPGEIEGPGDDGEGTDNMETPGTDSPDGEGNTGSLGIWWNI
jgi:hypothetical protein